MGSSAYFSRELLDVSGGVPAVVADLLAHPDDYLSYVEGDAAELVMSESGTAVVCSAAAGAVCATVSRLVEEQLAEVEAARAALARALARLLGARAYLRALQKAGEACAKEADVWAPKVEKLAEPADGPGGPGGV